MLGAAQQYATPPPAAGQSSGAPDSAGQNDAGLHTVGTAAPAGHAEPAGHGCVVFATVPEGQKYRIGHVFALPSPPQKAPAGHTVVFVMVEKFPATAGVVVHHPGAHWRGVGDPARASPVVMPHSSNVTQQSSPAPPPPPHTHTRTHMHKIRYQT